METSVAGLETSLVLWEWLEYSAVFFVIMACAGEYVAEFTGFWTEKIRHRLGKASTLILVAALAAELVCLVRSNSISGQIIARLQEQAAETARDAAKANERGSSNEQETARLKKLAEDERAARIQVEAQVAWRRLIPNQKAEIAKHLATQLPNQLVSFWALAGDPEGLSFASDIAEAVKLAKSLRVQAPATFMVMQASGPIGAPIKAVETGVRIQSTDDMASRGLAENLIKELNRFGYDASRVTDPPFDRNPKPQVWVNVMSRPNGPQGEFKISEGARLSKSK